MSMQKERTNFGKKLLVALLGVLFAVALATGLLFVQERSELPVTAQAASTSHTDCEGGHVGWNKLTDGGTLGGV